VRIPKRCTSKRHITEIKRECRRKLRSGIQSLIDRTGQCLHRAREVSNVIQLDVNVFADFGAPIAMNDVAPNQDVLHQRTYNEKWISALHRSFPMVCSHSRMVRSALLIRTVKSACVQR